MRRTNYSALLMLALALVLAFMLYRTKYAQSRQLYDSSVIMEKISYVKELSLVKYSYSGVISFTDYLRFINLQVPMTEKSFLIKYTGYVKAGIDVSKTTVSVKGKTVKIGLPIPVIQETVIDEKSLQVYDESMNILNPIKVADYQKAIVAEQNKIKQDALAKGILTESSDQAHKFITSLLEELGFEIIEIDEINTLTLPQKELNRN
ncbi:MAG: DUF4230 domain-containing protein [Paludibacteraceae bacterium]|nr:DUF4230 domain-containing protein [Paludibacteraceae bacterium]